jgi:phosphatidylinositol alpha-mannosyltransferase
VKIGFVSPYAWDVPGGVQAHIRDLAHFFKSQGHEISILAPAMDESAIEEDFVVPAGRPVAIPFNGAVARVLFGPLAASRVRQWLISNNFDLLHLHEPAIPSLSLLACSIAEGPMVGTFHAAAPRQKIAFAIAPFIEPIVEKLRARIAVSEFARETLRIHLDTDAVVIPNGIDVKTFRDAQPNPSWSRGTSIGFVGRFNEPRKGLDLLLESLPDIVRIHPEVRLLIAGPGEGLEVMQSLQPGLRSRIEFLGRISDEEKATLLRSVSVYVAPNTGGESFGIILAEAMAAGAAIVASDLPAFDTVLSGGRYGKLFSNGDRTGLATEIISLLSNDQERERLGKLATEGAEKFDWSQVGPQVMNVYLHAIGDGERITVGNEQRGISRILRGEDRE